MQREKTLELAAAKAGMSEKTARKYLKSGELPSERPPTSRKDSSREDAFEGVWEEILGFLDINSGLQAVTLFKYLQKESPGKYQDGQLRTLQRRIKVWRATEGPAKEVFFAQKHTPGRLSQSDFTNMDDLGVMIGGVPFLHMVYHFVLTYSNWEDATICFSESFESLSQGLQNAMWELGGVPENHQTDQLTTAVQKTEHPKEFTQRYQALLDHYGLVGLKIRVREPHENGDVEQRHYRFKQAVDQALMLRGYRDFVSREEYAGFLESLLKELNAGRSERLAEELAVLRSLPRTRLDSRRHLKVPVGQGSTIRILKNVYSVHSRLQGETVDVWVDAEKIEVWYAQRKVDEFPRLRGEGKHQINYRHLIDSLVRKPGAFENYRYREDLFPTFYFRMVYDMLQKTSPSRASREYLGILELAAKEGEAEVDAVLQYALLNHHPISKDTIKAALGSAVRRPGPTEVAIDDVELVSYDIFLREEVEECHLIS
ncbi:MAG: IS21 family transposase [Candidatus Eisenbacteria bacterium]|uniref:IS21 family transposase n=1 Tax=Eiseniibacteriota bacterium TaxID=2212470 RepID=A0A948W636_UNCEI|nr:IS21 family transposase [Candidatus Eisenbacteria bacterium]MBU2690221.1 IS21 family transposase [Candidatus Eisenbacteria bacterium]